MNLTLTQAYHRTQDLGGLIKAGESALADCEADAEAKLRIASIAADGVEKARANLDALKQEREELAVLMADLVRCVGEGVLLLDPAFADFGHPLQNGDDTKLNAAFDVATHP
jgi:hypothetical protein